MRKSWDSAYLDTDFRTEASRNPKARSKPPQSIKTMPGLFPRKPLSPPVWRGRGTKNSDIAAISSIWFTSNGFRILMPSIDWELKSPSKVVFKPKNCVKVHDTAPKDVSRKLMEMGIRSVGWCAYGLTLLINFETSKDATKFLLMWPGDAEPMTGD